MNTLDKIFDVIFSIIQYAFFAFFFFLIFSKKNKSRNNAQNLGPDSKDVNYSLIKKNTAETEKTEALAAGSEPKSLIFHLANLIWNKAQVIVPPGQFIAFGQKPAGLKKRVRYLQIALNSSLDEALSILSKLPANERVIIEIGTPLIKIHGLYEAVSSLRAVASVGAYFVADLKTSDLASREVKQAAQAGVQAAVCLGVAPLETIRSFIEACATEQIDSMLDMMNVADPLAVLKKLSKLPRVVILHRGVDESEFSKDKQIPFYQIQQIKGNFNNVLVAVAGGDTIREVQSSVFNGADIVVAWKDFYKLSDDTASLAQQFLKEIK